MISRTHRRPTPAFAVGWNPLADPHFIIDMFPCTCLPWKGDVIGRGGNGNGNAGPQWVLDIINNWKPLQQPTQVNQISSIFERELAWPQGLLLLLLLLSWGHHQPLDQTTGRWSFGLRRDEQDDKALRCHGRVPQHGRLPGHAQDGWPNGRGQGHVYGRQFSRYYSNGSEIKILSLFAAASLSGVYPSNAFNLDFNLGQILSISEAKYFPKLFASRRDNIWPKNNFKSFNKLDA